MTLQTEQTNVNKEVIKELRKIQKNMFGNYGEYIFSRGSSKSMLELKKYLAYMGIDYICDRYSKITEKRTLKQGLNDVSEFIILAMMNIEK